MQFSKSRLILGIFVIVLLVLVRTLFSFVITGFNKISNADIFDHHHHKKNNHSNSFEISCPEDQKFCEVWNIRKECVDRLLILSVAYGILLIAANKFIFFLDIFTVFFNKLLFSQSLIKTPSIPPPITSNKFHYLQKSIILLIIFSSKLLLKRK
jgi:hypothetical protein